MFSRETRTEVDAFNNKTYTMMNYDARGNVSAKPALINFFSGNTFAPLITTNSYDNLNRITQSSTNDGIKTNIVGYAYSYNNADITVTTTAPDGKNSSVTNDATNLLKAASDNGGNITYSYYGNRQVKDIIVNGTQANHVEYDQYARQTKLQDRDAGISLYDYNGYGELSAQTDANNKTYNYSYDILGRLTQGTGPDGAYNYQYINSGGGLNKLQQTTALMDIILNYTMII